MNPQAFRALKFMATLALAAILGGCAFGRSYSYNDAPVAISHSDAPGRAKQALVATGAPPRAGDAP